MILPPWAPAREPSIIPGIPLINIAMLIEIIQNVCAIWGFAGQRKRFAVLKDLYVRAKEPVRIFILIVNTAMKTSESSEI